MRESKGNRFTKRFVFIVIMGGIGNILGMVSLSLPVPSPMRLELHFSQLTPLLVGISMGPLDGAIVGMISLIVATVKIGNPMIPLGNAILAYVAGLMAKRFRPLIAGMIGEIAETPFIWFSMIIWVHIVCGVPLEVLVPIILMVNIKAFIEVFISSLVIEVLLKSKEIRRLLNAIKRGSDNAGFCERH